MRDIGVPSRTHRNGVFGEEFAHVGTSIHARGDGAFVCVSHFARPPMGELLRSWPRVGMVRMGTSSASFIELSSSDDEAIRPRSDEAQMLQPPYLEDSSAPGAPIALSA